MVLFYVYAYGLPFIGIIVYSRDVLTNLSIRLDEDIYYTLCLTVVLVFDLQFIFQASGCLERL